MDNKLGVYYGFLADSDEVNWSDCLKRARKAGLDILEMSASKLQAESPEKRSDLAKEARDLGLGLTFATGLPMCGDVSSFDPEARLFGANLLIDQIKLVSEMDGTALGGIITGVGKNFPKSIETYRDSAVDNAILALKQVAEAACDYGVKVGVEVVNRFESPLINTSVEGLRVANAIDSPNLGLLLDVFHMNIEEDDLPRAILAAGDRLIHFHACENNRALPGHGHIDWNALFKALKEVNYNGAIVMEALVGPYGTVAGRLNIWRGLCGDADKELAEAVGFLRGIMAAQK